MPAVYNIVKCLVLYLFISTQPMSARILLIKEVAKLGIYKFYAKPSVTFYSLVLTVFIFGCKSFNKA